MSRLMVRLAALATLMTVAAGCAGGPDESDRREQDQKMAALRNELMREITNLQTKYAQSLEMVNRVNGAVEEAKRMTRVTPVMVDFLKKQENTLQAQLEEVRALIKRLEAGN